MKTVLALAALVLSPALAQDPTKPMPRTAGVSVQMAASRNAVAIRAADELDAKVVAITAEGKVYNGVTVVEPESLAAITEKAVYVKADARAPFQKVLAVLEALRGKQIALLTAPPVKPAPGTMTPPYGVRLSVPE